MSSKRTFLSKVKEQRKTYLIKDLNLLTKNINELKMLMCSMLSFFIIQSQIDKADNNTESKQELLDLFQSKTEEHLLGITKYGYSSQEIFSLKKLLHFCAYCCKKKNMSDEEAV